MPKLEEEFAEACQLNDNDEAAIDETRHDDNPNKPTTAEETSEEIDADCARRKLEDELTEEEREKRKIQAQELKKSGNEFFLSGEYQPAIENYEDALAVCPLSYTSERSILFSNAAACHHRLEDKDKAIEYCTKALELNSTYLKARVRRAQLYEDTDKLDEALEDYKIVLEQDPDHNNARAACAILPGRIQERNEKLKTEMLGKLKDLGNLILRPFGLSTDNFQMQQNPDSGGYSINFKNN